MIFCSVVCSWHNALVFSKMTIVCSFSLPFSYMHMTCYANVLLRKIIRCFLRKDGTLIELKTLITETDNTSSLLPNDLQLKCLLHVHRPKCTSDADRT